MSGIASELVEEVAKSIFFTANRHTTAIWEKSSEESKDAYREEARSAIGAIRKFVAASEAWPECSGDPANCPEYEGYGCCKPNTMPENNLTALVEDIVGAARWRTGDPFHPMTIVGKLDLRDALSRHDEYFIVRKGANA